MTSLKKVLLMTTAALVTLGAAQQADAAGFYIQEQSVSGLGNSFAGSAAQPRDASIIFYNPAGMTYLKGTNINVGVSVLIPKSEMTDKGSRMPLGSPASSGDGGNPYDPTPVPSAYISRQINDNFWIGLGVSAPFGLANDYDDGWFGRYDSTETELTTIDIAPSMAYKVNDQLSIGGSIFLQTADATLKNNLFGATEGRQTLEGDSMSLGWKLGILAEPWKGTRFGLDYRSEVTQELDGRLILEGTGAAALTSNIAGRAKLHLPDISTFSVAHDLNERLTLLGSATYFSWSDFDKIEVKTTTGVPISSIEQNYQNTWAFSAGFDYKLNDAWTMRAGYQFDETPTTDEYRTSRTPDGDRHWFSLGGTYNWNDQWSFDFAGTYIDIAKEEINLARNIPANPSNMRADSEGHVIILGAGVNYKF